MVVFVPAELTVINSASCSQLSTDGKIPICGHARLARYRPFTSYRKRYGFLIRIRPVGSGFES